VPVTPQSDLSQPYVIRNNAALFPWLLMAAWMLGLSLVTWVAFRDVLAGGPVTFRWMPLILAVFWLAGIGFSILVLRLKRLRVTFAGGRVEIIRRSPLRATRWEGSTRDVLDVRLDETTDSDGDPYFKCVLAIPGPERIVIAEGHDRATIEAVRDRVNAIRAVG
jgi:hypothetical protein